jgi:hypothetical protein
MPSRSALLLSAIALLAQPVSAQWRAGLEAGVERVPRFAVPSEEQEVARQARPGMTWPLSLRLERGGEGARLALVASRVNPGLELDDGELAVLIRPGFRIVTVAPELSLPLARLSGDAALRWHLAIPLERWSFPGLADDPRWRAGAAVGATLEVPVSSSLALRVGGQLGRLFGNPLEDSEMTEDYTPTAMWRRSARVGLVRQLR